MQLWLLQTDQHDEEQSIHGHNWAVLIGIVVFASIWAILRHRGPCICTLACLYVASLVAIALVMRALTRPPLLYRFPASVTLLHYICTWVVCIAYCLAIRKPGHLLPNSVGGIRRYLVRMVPIALALPVSVTFNNKALVYIGAGLASVVGTLSPVCTAVMSRCLGRRLTLTSWFGVFVAFGGALWAGSSELQMIIRRESKSSARFMFQGLCFSFAALIMRSVRVVLQDSLLSPAAYTPPGEDALEGRAPAAGNEKEKMKEKEEPELAIGGMHLLAAQSPLVVAVALVFTLLTERIGDAVHAITARVSVLLAVTSVLAVMLNILGACVLKELGSTSMQIIGKLNSIVTTAVSMAFFFERLPIPVLFGSGVVLIGVAIFEFGEIHGMKQPRKE